ncbi:hypothetical protein HYPP_01953 [Hyphomicrobium sp. ghe19]|nr:hypothetical protein HYPP_01953 [Hyphomicrobium sp. ghe19]
MELAIVIAGAVVVYRACLTAVFYPVPFWDFRRWH